MIVTMKGLDELISLMARHRVGFTNGCFDILHAGHVDFLKQCQSKCDILLLAVNTDLSVYHLKGEGRPRMEWEDRAQLLEALDVATFIFEMGDPDPRSLLKHTKPNVFFKSEEYRDKKMVEQGILTLHQIEVEFIPIKHTIHSSDIT